MADRRDCMDNMPGNSAGMGGPQPQLQDYNPRFVHLEEGLEVAFGNVMQKLADIDTNLSGLSTTILGALPTQNRFSRSIAHDRINGSGGIVGPSPDNTESLANQIQVLEIEKSQLEQRIQQNDANVIKRAAADADLRREISDLKLENARLRADKDKFRTMVLSSASSTQKVTDQEVIQAFSDVRQRVQQIAANSIFDLKMMPKITVDSNTMILSKMRQFYNQCKGLERVDMGHRVKSQIFSILFEYILDKTCFGLKRDLKSDKNDLKMRELWDMEENLQRFEQFLRTNKGNDYEVASWRIVTLDCITRLNMGEKYSHYAANYMHEFFSPLIPQTVSKELVREMCQKMLELSQKCLTLKSMMQRSKEGYAIEILDTRHLYSRKEQYVECMGVENGKSADASDDIAFLLFGILMKRTEKKVLVKGEAILKPRSKPRRTLF